MGTGRHVPAEQYDFQSLGPGLRRGDETGSVPSIVTPAQAGAQRLKALRPLVGFGFIQHSIYESAVSDLRTRPWLGWLRHRPLPMRRAPFAMFVVDEYLATLDVAKRIAAGRCPPPARFRARFAAFHAGSAVGWFVLAGGDDGMPSGVAGFGDGVGNF
jgi:hypothetical protein